VTATYEARQRRKLLDRIHALAIEGAEDVEGQRVADPLTGPRPAHVFASEQEPIYMALVAEDGVPGQDHVGAGPVIVGELATQAIDMTVLLNEQVA
jgi:hypothetical protein